jgi:long-chain acyl-CoA synthetase
MVKDGAYLGDRVLCTHDLFLTDEEGYLYFVARTDEIIKTRGEKVSPVKVEAALYSIPSVREAAVIGVNHPVLGEEIRAFVASDPDTGLTEHSVKRACQARLENFMVPKACAFPRIAAEDGHRKASKSKICSILFPRSLRMNPI